MNSLGDIEITLKDKPHVLRCSMRALKTVSELTGGIQGALEGIARVNFSVYAAIVAAGLNKRTNAELVEIEEAIYQTGLPSLVSPLTKYVLRLMNKGLDPEPYDPGEPNQGKE